MSDDGTKRMAIIVAHGGLDDAYPPLILASAAATMDMEVTLFFTFYGLDVINKHKMPRLKVAAVGNPAMPVPVPSLVGVLPGMNAMAASMMKGWMSKAGTASVPELVEICQELDVRFIACKMTMDVLGIAEDDLIDGVEYGGAAAFIEFAADADITLYM